MKPDRPLLALVALVALSLLLGPWSGATAAPRTAGTTFDYDSALVPSVCGFPAGRLVDGEMTVPASPDNDEGFVRIRPGRRDSGSFTDAGEVLFAGTLESGSTHWCNDTLVLWRADGSIAHATYLGQVFPGSEHARVHDLGFDDDGRLGVRVLDVAQTESDWIAPIASGRLTLGLVDGEIAVTSSELVTERPTVRKFIKAVKQRQKRTAMKYATEKVAKEALRVTRHWKRGHFQPLETCVSLADDGWPGWVETRYQRMCFMTVSDGEHGSAYGLFVDRVGWDRFKIKQIEGVAG